MIYFYLLILNPIKTKGMKDSFRKSNKNPLIWKLTLLLIDSLNAI